MGRFTLAAALALLAVPAQAGVEVTAIDGRLDVTAAQAPLSEVLDGLARKTRMKIEYEGGAPRTPVTVDLHGRTPAEAVLAVLEGLGLNYMLALDVSGTEVVTLMIVGGGGGTMTGSAPEKAMTSSGSAMRNARGRRELPQSDDDDGEQPGDYEIAPMAPDPPKVEPARPAMPVGPLNPTNPFPGGGAPMLPGPPLVAPPSPNPNPPTSR
jgi:hypothetical protein